MTIATAEKKLNLGAGNDQSTPDWVALDIVSTFRPDVLGSAYHLPFQDDSLKAVKCHHVLEHLPRDYFVFHPERHSSLDKTWDIEPTVIPAYIESRKGLVDVMNEVWRVTQTGGQLWIEVPLFPTEEAIADPTHGSFFVSGTFDYFNRCDVHTDDLAHNFTCREDHRQMYGIKPWKITRREKVNHARILVVFMTKVADA